MCILAGSTVGAMLPWQFTPLVLATQTLCLCALLTFDLITVRHLLMLVGTLTVSLRALLNSEPLIVSLFSFIVIIITYQSYKGKNCHFEPLSLNVHNLS